MRYARGVLVTLFAKGFVIPIGILSSIITARVLGPEGRGVLAVLVFYQGMTVTFGTLGFNASITYYMSRDPHLAPGIVRNAVTVAFLGGIVVAAGLWGASVLFPAIVLGNVSRFYLEIFLLSVPFTLLAQFLQNVFLAKQKIFEFNLLEIGVRSTLLVGYGIVLWGMGGGTTSAVWVFTIVAVAAGIAYTVRAHAVQPFTPGFEPELFASMFSYGAKVYVAGLFMFLVIRIHLLVVNVYLGEAQAGVFSVALQIVDVVYLIPVTLGMILYPKVSAGEDQQGLLLSKILRMTLWGMLMFSCFLGLFSPQIVLLLFGTEFKEAGDVLRAFLPGITALSLVTVLNNYLMGRAFARIVIFTPLMTLALMIPVFPLAVEMYGMVGAAYVASGGYILMFALLARSAHRILKCPWADFFALRVEDLRIRF